MKTAISTVLLSFLITMCCVACSSDEVGSSTADAGDTVQSDATMDAPWFDVANGSQDAGPDATVEDTTVGDATVDDSGVDQPTAEVGDDPTADPVSDDAFDSSGDPGQDLSDYERVCDDGIDDDGDGFTDCEDAECRGDPVCSHETNCDDWHDNDNDGLIDCADPGDCQSLEICQSSEDAGPVGAPCTTASDCASTNGPPACTIEHYYWPDGYCHQFCDTNDQDCPEGAICYPAFHHGSQGLCLDRCDAETDPCRDDSMYDDYYDEDVVYMCEAVEHLPSDVTVCVPSWFW